MANDVGLSPHIVQAAKRAASENADEYLKAIYMYAGVGFIGRFVTFIDKC